MNSAVFERVRQVLDGEDREYVEDYIEEMKSYADEEAYGPDSTDEEIMNDFVVYMRIRRANEL